MNDMESMAAIESIKQLKARYFRCLDTGDWAGMETVFAPDLVADISQAVMEHHEKEPIRGGRTFARFIQSSVDGLVTVHHGHMPEIKLTSPTTATGIWAMEDKLWKKKPSTSTLPFEFLHGYGHYHETYEKIGGTWRIKTWKLTRLRLDIV